MVSFIQFLIFIFSPLYQLLWLSCELNLHSCWNFSWSDLHVNSFKMLDADSWGTEEKGWGMWATAKPEKVSNLSRISFVFSFRFIYIYIVFNRELIFNVIQGPTRKVQKLCWRAYQVWAVTACHHEWVRFTLRSQLPNWNSCLNFFAGSATCNCCMKNGWALWLISARLMITQNMEVKIFWVIYFCNQAFVACCNSLMVYLHLLQDQNSADREINRPSIKWL